MATGTRLLARRDRPQLWAAALFVVLAGLVGMHGLGDHGMPGMAGTATAREGRAVMRPAGLHRMSAHPDQPPGDAQTTAPVARDPGATSSPAPAGLPGQPHMAALCLALPAGGLPALFLRRGRALRVMAAAPRASCLGRRPRGPDPDPPCLDCLSILRC